MSEENSVPSAPRTRTERQKANDARLKEFWTNYHRARGGGGEGGASGAPPVESAKPKGENKALVPSARPAEPARRPIVRPSGETISEPKVSRRKSRGGRPNGRTKGNSDGNESGQADSSKPKAPVKSGPFMF